MGTAAGIESSLVFPAGLPSAFVCNEVRSDLSAGSMNACRPGRGGGKVGKRVILVRANGGEDDVEGGKTPVSSSRWLYRGNSLISQTVLQPVPIPKATGPWRRGLLELIGDITSGAPVRSVLELWIDGLSVKECNKIMVEVGNRDWSLAMDVFRFLKERSPYIQKASSGGMEIVDADAKSGVIDPGNGADAGSKASDLLKAYTTLVGVLSRNGRLPELTALLHEMEQEEVEPDLRFYNGVAEAYSNMGMVPHVSEVVTQIEKCGLQPDHATYELMITAHLQAKVPKLEAAVQVFKNMLRNKLKVGAATYIKLIDSCVDARDLNSGEEVFTAMRASGHPIYSKVSRTIQRVDVLRCFKTWVKMIQLHASSGGSKKAEQLFRAMRASGVLPTASIYDALLLAYCRAGCLDQAFSVFREYKLESKPSLIAYNHLIDASGKRGRYEDSLALYSELSSNGLRPSTATYTSLICAMVQAGHYGKADKLYKKMLQKNLVPSGHTVTAVLHAYTSCGWTRLGHEVCSKLKEFKVEMTPILCGSILRLYVQGRWYGEAVQVMREMESRGIEPDTSGYGVLIAALGEVGEKLAPFAKAMESSDWAPCRIAAFLVSNQFCADDVCGGTEDLVLERVWSFLETWATEKDRETNRSFYNALMDALWRRGLRRRAQLVMQKARQLLQWYNRPRTGANSVLDLRGLSIGGALVALLDWLENAGAESCLQRPGHTMVINTGGVEAGTDAPLPLKGKGVGAVKQAVAAYLEEQCSPFRDALESGPGRLHADSELVLQWLGRPDIREALELHDNI